jgi:class I fructose-bisphosphate aldolase
MGLAKTTRLNRIFSNPDGRILSLAVDHFAGQSIPEGLHNVPATVERLMEARPDAVTMIKGMARSSWEPYAGRIPLILQSIIFPRTDVPLRRTTWCDEALLLGADAVAVSLQVCGKSEGDHLALFSEIVRDAALLDLPVVAHIYPHDFSYADAPAVLTDHESILWAVRCGVEYGADVIKVPFTGDTDGFREIIATSPVPVVCAGGPKTKTFEDALRMVEGVVASGARGLVAGRNIWGAEDPVAAFRACRALVHPDEA